MRGSWLRLAWTAMAIVLATGLIGTPARALVITQGCAAADRCTLDELFAGASIQVNDKVFSDWTLEADLGSVQPDLTQIEVVGQDDGGLDPGPGLLFLGNGQLVVMGGDFLDLRFGFFAQVVPGVDLAIVDNSLELLEWMVGASFLSIDETLFDAAGNLIGTKHVEVDGLFGIEIPFDRLDFPEQRFLFIEKEIFLDAGGDFAELLAFEQRFSQVFEPGSLGLLGAGLGVLGWRRRRNTA